MATRAAARSLFRSSSSLRSSFIRPTSARTVPSGIPNRSGVAAQASRFMRSPVEMSSFCVESLMPMHSATASAVMNSLLVASRRGCGWLSEGQDETR